MILQNKESQLGNQAYHWPLGRKQPVFVVLVLLGPLQNPSSSMSQEYTHRGTVQTSHVYAPKVAV